MSNPPLSTPSPEIHHALILAAGRGQRMMPLTESIPKPMAPYQGSTLIAEGIARLKPWVEHIHVTVGYKGAMLAEHVITQGISSVFNTREHGNAWWLYHTLLGELDQAVLVLTCDNVVDLDLDLLQRQYQAVGRPACMLVPVRPVAGLEGDYLFLDGNTVVGLDRHRPSDRYCSGIQVVNPRAIRRLTKETDSFYEVWSQLISKGQLAASALYTGGWFAVDTIDQLNRLNATIVK